MGIFSRKKKEDIKEIDGQKKASVVKVENNKKPILHSAKNEAVKTKSHVRAYKNLIRPITTEKVSMLGAQDQYVFEVNSKTNKIEIKKAVYDLYGVSPAKVNIINVRGKMTRYGRNFGKKKNWKKAVVVLKQGEKIEVYEGV
ncbi:MAG: 50S ribosomal protein L23 [Patescibacteria group bacterium]